MWLLIHEMKDSPIISILTSLGRIFFIRSFGPNSFHIPPIPLAAAKIEYRHLHQWDKGNAKVVATQVEFVKVEQVTVGWK